MTQTQKRPTIGDVARAAGVSVGTVSNVMNGTRPVSDGARERVEAAANALGFQFNALAQTLRRRTSRTVGLCTTHMTTTYLRELAIALDAIASRNNYELIQVQSHQDPQTELARVKSLMSRQVDGMILLPSLDPEASLAAISRRGMPVVVIDRQPHDPKFASVIIDNFSAMQGVVEALHAKGHRRILFIAQNLAVVTTRQRIAGLQQSALSLDGLESEVIARGQDEAAFTAQLAGLLSRSPQFTAIITGNSSVALSTIRALRELGRRLADDIALVTFDDPDWADVVTPAISTVRAPIEEMARATWSSLIKQIEGQEPSSQLVALSAQYVERASSQIKF